MSEMTLEEKFENAKSVFVATCEVSVKNAERIDNMLNIRDLMYKFWGERIDRDFTPKERWDYYLEMRNLSIETYKAILETVKTFELEEFLKDDMKDYFEDIVPKVEDIHSETELFCGLLVFLTVKPYGERMVQLHHSMLEEAVKEELEEEK